MLTRDPARLLLIIKDREIMLGRLYKALKDSKEDGMGDAFKINRFVKHHEVLLKSLHDDYNLLVEENKRLEQIRKIQYAKIEQAEVEALRSSLRLYDINDRRL